jgi:hypothetical protein
MAVLAFGPVEYSVLPPQVHFTAMSPTGVPAAVSNDIAIPDLDLPVRDGFSVDIKARGHTANLLKLNKLAPNP